MQETVRKYSSYYPIHLYRVHRTTINKRIFVSSNMTTYKCICMMQIVNITEATNPSSVQDMPVYKYTRSYNTCLQVKCMFTYNMTCDTYDIHPSLLDLIYHLSLNIIIQGLHETANVGFLAHTAVLSSLPRTAVLGHTVYTFLTSFTYSAFQ